MLIYCATRGTIGLGAPLGDLSMQVTMKRVFLALSFVAIVTAGCQTPQNSRRVQAATTAVLAAHHFAPPTFVTGDERLFWAVAARPQSGSAVQTACVRLNPDGRASVELTSYQYVGSDWAIVGRLFDQGRSQQEAAEIQREIYRNLQTQ